MAGPGERRDGRQLGVTVDASGAPVLLLEICRGSIDRITLVGPNVNGRNEFFAGLTPPAPLTTSTTVDPLDLPDGWTSTAATLPYSTDPALLHISSGWGPQNSLRQVSFTRDSLAGLDPDAVQYSAFDTGVQDMVDRRMPREAFHAFVCDPLPA